MFRRLTGHDHPPAPRLQVRAVTPSSNPAIRASRSIARDMGRPCGCDHPRRGHAHVRSGAARQMGQSTRHHSGEDRYHAAARGRVGQREIHRHMGAEHALQEGRGKGENAVQSGKGIEGPRHDPPAPGDFHLDVQRWTLVPPPTHDPKHGGRRQSRHLCRWEERQGDAGVDSSRAQGAWHVDRQPLRRPLLDGAEGGTRHGKRRSTPALTGLVVRHAIRPGLGRRTHRGRQGPYAHLEWQPLESYGRAGSDRSGDRHGPDGTRDRTCHGRLGAAPVGNAYGAGKRVWCPPRTPRESGR